ncbi:MAG: sulfotransferase domain-containing protein [Anaerolineales bacterium]|nr:sulfotransferase domain-containing protein [Anaerolineales bacterium]
MKGIFKKLFGSSKPVVTVVSGLPRSGTSMMMKMLEAGGIPPLTDKIRTADDDNPKGYYEFERVKQMDKGDTAWMADAEGKTVKVISQLLRYMPAEHEYKVIFMRRNMSEILASQKKMLINRGEDPDQASDEEISALFEKHLNSVMDWMAARPNVSVMYVHYSDMLANPMPQVALINEFLGGNMDVQAMAEVVDPNLYRNRKNRLKTDQSASK